MQPAGSPATGGRMKVVLNGLERVVEPGMSVRDLLGTLGLDPRNVAVELNSEIVKKARYDATILSERDRLEIVHFVGGG